MYVTSMLIISFQIYLKAKRTRFIMLDNNKRCLKTFAKNVRSFVSLVYNLTLDAY